MARNYRRVNLFGRPGAGKSTVAAHIYHEMKVNDFAVELVNEYVKSWAYMGRKIRSFDQVYIFGKQLNAEDRLLFHSDLDYIVSDSPILIQYCYASLNNDPISGSLLEISRQFDKVFKPLNIFLDNKLDKHDNAGRFHDLEASNKAAQLMRDVLQIEYGNYIICDPANPASIAKLVLEKLRNA